MGVGLLVKVSLLRLGGRMSERAVHAVNAAADYVELGWWLRARGFTGGVRVADCSRIAAAVGAAIGDRPALYMQFGADDATMAARFAAALAHPESTLVVFEPPSAGSDWLPGRGRGHAAAFPHTLGRSSVETTSGDYRVRVVGGAPLATLLAGYQLPLGAPLVAVFDTDLYATTKLALDHLRDRLADEAYLVFDQLNHRADELRAFHEFLMETDARFELFAANRELSCVVFRRTA